MEGGGGGVLPSSTCIPSLTETTFFLGLSEIKASPSQSGWVADPCFYAKIFTLITHSVSILLQTKGNKNILRCFRVSSCCVFIANSFFSSHQESVFCKHDVLAGLPDHFQVELENGWGNPAETSCFAKMTAGVTRKRNKHTQVILIE